MANRAPLVGVAALLAVLAVGSLVGGVAGVGPLAAPVPADKVTDPGEMLARSLQSVIDARAVHLDATVDGPPPRRAARPAGGNRRPRRLPGRGRRPSEGREDARARRERRPGRRPRRRHGLGRVWYRTGASAPWRRASLGAVSAEAGVDANPLTLVDRVRGYLARPDVTPSVRDVACAAPSGRCRHIELDAGTEPSTILGLLLPPERAADLPPARTSSRSTPTPRRSARSTSWSTCAATTGRWTWSWSSTRRTGTRTWSSRSPRRALRSGS